MGWRLSGLFTPPIDAPNGKEATHAALVSLLSGHTQGAIDTLRPLAPVAPWVGESGVNPDAGFPLYDWLCAALVDSFGFGDWIGRIVSLVFAVAAGLILFALVRKTGRERQPGLVARSERRRSLSTY